jgi:HSP20 family protein
MARAARGAADDDPPDRSYHQDMPWDPIRDLLTMQERLESLFGRTTPGWVPPVELSEFPDRYLLTVELAGLSREDFRIELQDGTLSVSGERRAQSCCPERYQQLERGQGPFSRSFRFAVPVDGSDVRADLADGVLTITVPKRLPSDTRRIDVS